MFLVFARKSESNETYEERFSTIIASFEARFPGLMDYAYKENIFFHQEIKGPLQMEVDAWAQQFQPLLYGWPRGGYENPSIEKKINVWAEANKGEDLAIKKRRELFEAILGRKPTLTEVRSLKDFLSAGNPLTRESFETMSAYLAIPASTLQTEFEAWEKLYFYIHQPRALEAAIDNSRVGIATPASQTYQVKRGTIGGTLVLVQSKNRIIWDWEVEKETGVIGEKWISVEPYFPEEKA